MSHLEIRLATEVLLNPLLISHRGLIFELYLVPEAYFLKTGFCFVVALKSMSFSGIFKSKLPSPLVWLGFFWGSYTCCLLIPKAALPKNHKEET